MAERNAEQARQYLVVSEDGKRGHASEETARKALSEGGWKLGFSPIVSALTRPDADSEWQPFPPDQAEA